MPRTVFLAVFLSILLIFSLVPLPNAVAQDVADAYLVKDVHVDILDESAVKARNKAFGLAQEKAFGILSERFKTLDKFSVDKLPKASVLSGLVQDFEIVDEQTSLKRYRGTYDFRFRPAAVRGFFGHGPTNYGGAADGAVKKNVLLLPFFMKGNSATIWAKQRNPIFQAVELKIRSEGNVMLPAGDIMDTSDVKDIDPHRLTLTTLNKLKARYNVEDIAIVLGQVDLASPRQLTVSLLRTDRGFVEVVSETKYEETVPPQQGDANVFLQASKKVLLDLAGDWKNTGLSVPLPNEDVSQASSVTSALEAATQNPVMGQRPLTIANPSEVRDVRPPENNVSQNSAEGSTVFKVYFTSIEQWLNMQKQLQRLPSVTLVEMMSMKTDQAELHIVYKDWNVLQNALIQRGFKIEQDGENYIIKRGKTVF